MKNELKDEKLNEVSGGEVTEVTKWKVHTMWGNDEITGEFSTKEEAEDYEKRLEKIRETCTRHDATFMEHLWFGNPKFRK